MSDIQVSDHGAVRLLAIDRPERRNALTTATAEELRAQVEDADRDRGVGAVVLTGTGGHFSAGGDAQAILDVIADDTEAAALELMRTFHRLIEAIWNCRLPVIAAVSGVAYGGGFNLALACDLVVCSEDARFCQVFLRRGLVPDVGGAYLLPRLVGVLRAKELMFRASELGAREALELGLVNAVVADAAAARSRAVEIADELASGPGLAISLTKKLINASTTGTLQASLELEALCQAAALRSEPARGNFEAFLANRSEQG